MSHAVPRQLGPDDLMQMFQGTQVTMMLRSADDLGIFGAVAKGHADATAVAAAVGTDARATRLLLDALAALGLLIREGDRYRLTPVAEAHLLPESPAYMGNMGRIFTSSHVVDGMLRLPEIVRRGGTVLEQGAETPSHPFWEDFARFSVAMAAPGGQFIAQAMQPWASGRSSLSVLDVACGSGFYGYGVARAFPEARITSLDWPNVLVHARANAERLGVLDRVSFLGGDAFEVPLGGPHDVIVMSHIFHHFSEARNKALLARMASALKPDGRIIINDFIPTAGGDPASEPMPNLFSIVMLVWTKEGQAFDSAAYARWIEAAGLELVESYVIPGMESRVFVTEKKKG